MPVEAKNILNYQVEVRSGDHVWFADEPLIKGGDNQAPNPSDILLGALAACKIITVQMYASRKKWLLEGVSVKLSAKKVRASECEDCVSEPHMTVNIIEGEIWFEGNLTEEQKKRLLEISNRCPVQRTLTSETKIRVGLQPTAIGRLGE
jgi:uncharacterized OsmC-like protein